MKATSKVMARIFLGGKKKKTTFWLEQKVLGKQPRMKVAREKKFLPQFHHTPNTFRQPFNFLKFHRQFEVHGIQKIGCDGWLKQ